MLCFLKKLKKIMFKKTFFVCSESDSNLPKLYYEPKFFSIKLFKAYLKIHSNEFCLLSKLFLCSLALLVVAALLSIIIHISKVNPFRYFCAHIQQFLVENSKAI